METLSAAQKNQKHKGALRGTAQVLKTVANDPKTRHSARRIGSGTKTIGRVGAGIGYEIARDPEVRQAAKQTGRLALEGAGVARYDAVTGRLVPNKKGIKRAASFPDAALKNAIVEGREGTPKLGEAIRNAAPKAIRNYNLENPGALREAADATVDVAKNAITLPFHMGISAVNGVREIRESNRALEADAAKYRDAVSQPSSEASAPGFTVHTANGPVHVNIGVPSYPGQPSPPPLR